MLNPNPVQEREKKVSKLEQSGMTEEELLKAQEELFAQSRAKFQSAQQWRLWSVIVDSVFFVFVDDENMHSLYE